MRTLYISILLLPLIMLSSCSNFLEESSQDLEIPKTIKDYKELIYGEAYMRDENFVGQYLDVMTDDVTSYYGKPKLLA